MAQMTVYTTNPCPYCARAKALLSAREIEYGFDERWCGVHT
ncbi:MAG: hypothetical protein EBU46_08670 [Nitrosomonadaceae bacterium]|nr:hypothetical protein [Nitrosomonadaceae bacterium]